jgi:hypothetical protein
VSDVTAAAAAAPTTSDVGAGASAVVLAIVVVVLAALRKVVVVVVADGFSVCATQRGPSMDPCSLASSRPANEATWWSSNFAGDRPAIIGRDREFENKTRKKKQ